jgi:dolichyl-phosphate-mannose--protein O-mannosyl transferase
MIPTPIIIFPPFPLLLAIIGSLIPILVLGIKRPTFVSALFCVINATVEGMLVAIWTEGFNVEWILVGGSFGALWATVFCLLVFGIPAVMKNQRFIWLMLGTALGMNMGGLFGLALFDAKGRIFSMTLGALLGFLMGGVYTWKQRRKRETRNPQGTNF